MHVLPLDCYADDRFNQEHDKKTGFRTNNMLAMPIKAEEVSAVPSSASVEAQQAEQLVVQCTDQAVFCVVCV